MTIINSRYEESPKLQIKDARRGMTQGRIPRRRLQSATSFEYRMVPINWSVDRVAHETQGSMYAWWRIMDTNVEFLHPWEVMVGDYIRLPTMT